MDNFHDDQKRRARALALLRQAQRVAQEDSVRARQLIWQAAALADIGHRSQYRRALFECMAEALQISDIHPHVQQKTA
jgi:hypothetical protein